MSAKQLVLGILAHVDAGKTTLAEGLLYTCGSIRKAGRVDHGNAFLDTYALERARGITIFSKQARLQMGDLSVTLLDTPGHVDFSAEMERTLQVLDYAVLVISGADGVQGHVQTLWRLLQSYQVPVFLFINKMDQPDTDREALLAELKQRLDERCVDFSSCTAGGEDSGCDSRRDEWLENVAVCEESLLERFLEAGELSAGEIAGQIGRRKVFPCFFGSALKLEGVTELIQGLETYTRVPQYGQEFGARVFKISRDEQGNRLTHLKVTGGILKVKQQITGQEEKVNQIRLYSGAGFEAAAEAEAGTVCAVTGLNDTFAGQGLGAEKEAVRPILEPVLTYEIQLPEGCDVHKMLLSLHQLEEEEPMLHILWQEELGEIHAQVMGQVQMEILKHQILERFGAEVEFGAGNIVYKETILEPAEGVGHYEPLRHYAEVHLLLEPGEPGSGLQFDTVCSEDVLDRNWQRLILTHLMEKKHRGVLTGSEITDMKITLLTGRAHLKHTEGGDFRQATYRAVRQGLRSAWCALLEPVYAFRLEIPADKTGRAMADIQRMQGTFDPPEQSGELAILTGTAPVVAMRDYAQEVTAYTKGSGRLTCTLKGYERCHNEAEVLEAYAYDPEADLQNPTGSVFCAHGAGFVVPWDQVPDYMHVESPFREKPREEIRTGAVASAQNQPGSRASAPALSYENDKELQAIFERTYGAQKERGAAQATYVAGRPGWARSRSSNFHSGATGRSGAGNGADSACRGAKKPQGEDYLLVDGYNIIFAWEDLKELAQVNLAAARDKLMDVLCDYQGFKKNTLILVFDAYKVAGNPGSVSKYHNIHVVYTKEAETADQYIEKTVHEISRNHSVMVATSDALEQVIILGQGAGRMSAQGLREELEAAKIEVRQIIAGRRDSKKNTLFQHLPEELQEHMEQVRLGVRQLEDDW